MIRTQSLLLRRSCSDGKPEAEHGSDRDFQTVDKKGKVKKKTPVVHLEKCERGKSDDLSLKEFCQVFVSKSKCKEKLHHGTVKAIARMDRDISVLIELIEHCECIWSRNDIEVFFGDVDVKNYIVIPPTYITPIRFPEDCFHDFKVNDVCLVFSPKLAEYGYGWIKYNHRNPVIEMFATSSSNWSNSTVSNCNQLFAYSNDKRSITVDKRFLRSVFRPTKCGEGDLCSVFCGTDCPETAGIVIEVGRDNYVVTIPGNTALKFSRNFQMLKKFERVSSNVYRVPKQLVRKCSIEESSASDVFSVGTSGVESSQSNSIDGVLERSKTSWETVEIVPYSDVDGALCWIDVDYTKDFCKEPEHFGNVFVELSNCGNQIVGVELITACNCTILCDGTYKNTLYRQTPKPLQCIFVPKQHTTTVDFPESNTRLDKGTLCSVFLPSTKELCWGVCNHITDYGRVNLTMLNTELAESELQRKSGFVEGVSEEGRPVIEIHQTFVMPVFQTSAVKKYSRCSLYVPYHGIFNGLVIKKKSVTCHIFVNDGKIISVDDLGVDSSLFSRNNPLNAEFFVVSAFFLSSWEDDENSPEDIPSCSKSTNREVEVLPVDREPESDPRYSQRTVTRSAVNDYCSSSSSSYGKRSDVANSGKSSPPFRRELPPPVPLKRPERSRKKHEESQKTDFGHRKNYELEEKEIKFEIQDGHDYIGAFCRVDNKDIYRPDACKEHYGDVFVVLSNGVETVSGVELIVRCGCDHKTDGSFNGVMYLDRPQPLKCQFVPLRKVYPVFLKKDKESECQVGDLCYVHLPHTGKELLCKLHAKSANGRFELQLLSDQQTIDRMSIENSKFMDISDEKNLKLSIHSKFVRHAFRPSEVASGSICKVFVPGKEIIEGFVEKKGLKFSRIRFDYKVAQTLTDLGVDVHYFGRSDYGPELFKVSIDFLRKTEEGSCVNIAEEFSVSFEFRTCSIDPPTFHSLCPQSFSSVDSQKLHSGYNPSRASLSITSASYKGIESNHVKIGDFCVISEDHMKLVCDAKSHFGTVFAVLASKKGNPILGIELIETCICKIVCYGTYYDKQPVLETPRRDRCVFVPLTKVELITFEQRAMSDTDEARSAAIVDDVCDVFMPSLRRHYYAIVLAVSGGLLRMRIMDSSIRFFPKIYETGYPQVVSESKGNVFIELRSQFVRPVFRPSAVKDGNICNLFIPGQGKFQSLVETSQSDGILRVVVLDGDIDVKKANIDPSLLKQVAEGTFEVTHQLLFVLVATDQDNGRSAIGEGCKDEGLATRPPDCRNDMFEPVKIQNAGTANNQVQIKVSDSGLRKSEVCNSVNENINNLNVSSSTANAVSNNSVRTDLEIPKIADFCSISESYMARLCPSKDHFGTVFAVLAGNDTSNAIIGVELTQKCDCKIITDGTSYNIQPVLDEPREGKCLFIPASKVYVIKFKTIKCAPVELGAPKCNDVCDVFVPWLKNNFYGIVCSVSDASLRLKMMDSTIQFYPGFTTSADTISPNQKFIKHSGSIFIEVKSDFVRPLFRPSPINSGDICNLFIPEQGMFQCVAESVVGDDSFRIRTLYGTVELTNCSVDQTYFADTDQNDCFVVSKHLLFSLTNASSVQPQPLNSCATGGCSSFRGTEICSSPGQVTAAKKYLDLDVHLGKRKGLAGPPKSSSFRSLVYSLFLFSDSFDQTFLPSANDTPQVSARKLDFARLILNPLRAEDNYVPAANVEHFLRSFDSVLPGVSEDDFNVEEIAKVFLSKEVAGLQENPASFKVRNEVHVDIEEHNVYEIILEDIDCSDGYRLAVPSVETLLLRSFVSQRQFLYSQSKFLLIQIPKFGKEKLYFGVYPPLKLDVSEVSMKGDQNCSVCDESTAQFRCKTCSKSDSGKLFGENHWVVKFCDGCLGITHNRKVRCDHDVIKIPEKGDPLRGDNFKYRLQSVICDDHFGSVCFVRVKNAANQAEWVYFDSKGDRESYVDKDAAYIPEVKQCPLIENQLQELMGKSDIERQNYLIGRNEQRYQVHKLIVGARLAIYKQNEE